MLFVDIEYSFTVLWRVLHAKLQINPWVLSWPVHFFIQWSTTYFFSKSLEYNIRGTGKNCPKLYLNIYPSLFLILRKTLFSESDCVTDLQYILVNPLISIEKGSHSPWLWRMEALAAERLPILFYYFSSLTITVVLLLRGPTARVIISCICHWESWSRIVFHESRLHLWTVVGRT